MIGLQRSRGRGARPAGSVLVVLIALVGLLGLGSAGALAQPTEAPPPAVTVSLTFDDGLADQLNYLPALQRLGLRGTFYINTGAIDQPRYLTRADLGRIASAGSEIGGHTVSHAELTSDTSDEVQRQICDDRATLAAWGYTASSFAYPYGAYDPGVEVAARTCGYTSARRVGGLGPSGPACPDCVPAERIPPEDPQAVRTPGQVTSGTTLADLERLVGDAQRRGGWLPLVFHHESCDSCGNLSVPAELLTAFGTWLVDQQRAGLLTVRTVGEVMGGAPAPLAAAPRPAARPSGLANPGLEDGTDPDVPACWMRAGFGNNTATFRRVSDAHGGRSAEQVTITSYHDGDAKILPRLDLGQCTATVTPGQAYGFGAWYESTAATQVAVYLRSGSGSWRYWTSSPWYAPAATWTAVRWISPPVPPDATGLAAGLVLASPGALTTDDYGVTPPPPPPPPPPWRPSPYSIAAAAVALVGLLGAGVGLLLHGRARHGRGRSVVAEPASSEPASSEPASSEPAMKESRS